MHQADKMSAQPPREPAVAPPGTVDQPPLGHVEPLHDYLSLSPFVRMSRQRMQIPQSETLPHIDLRGTAARRAFEPLARLQPPARSDACTENWPDCWVRYLRSIGQRNPEHNELPNPTAYLCGCNSCTSLACKICAVGFHSIGVTSTHSTHPRGVCTC